VVSEPEPPPELEPAPSSWAARVTALAIVLVWLIVLGWLLGLLVRHTIGADATPIDAPVLRFMARHRTDARTTVADAVSALGSGGVVLPAAVAIGLVWRVAGRTWRPLALLVAAYVGATTIVHIDKWLVDRARPPVGLAVRPFSQMAFPSGHSMQAAATWGVLAALVVAHVRPGPTRAAVVVVAAVVIVGVGLTRLYLGAHWFTDVVAGWLLGGAWAFALVRIAGLRSARNGEA
jgi:undecaprenyl-diphosphatase